MASNAQSLKLWFFQSSWNVFQPKSRNGLRSQLIYQFFPGWSPADKWKKSTGKSFTPGQFIVSPTPARKAPVCRTLQWMQEGAFEHTVSSASKQSNEGLSFSCTNVLAFSCFWKEEPRSVSWCERYRLDDLRSSSLRPQHVKIPKSTQYTSSIQLKIFVHSFDFHLLRSFKTYLELSCWTSFYACNYAFWLGLSIKLKRQLL